MVDTVRSLDMGSAKLAAFGFMMLALACIDPARAEEERFRVSFNPSGQGAGNATTVAIACDDGSLLVAVAAGGADVSKSVVTLDGKPVAVTFAGYDPVSRLCFFRRDLPARAKQTVWLAKTPEKIGTELRAGAVLGETSGWVKRIGEKVLPLALVKIDFKGKPPVSGTPLTDSQGRVAALFFQMSDDGQCGYAIPAEAVERVLMDVKKAGMVTRGYLGVSLQVQNEKPQIIRVLQSSPASQAGIQEDDLISRIGTRNVVDYADVANAFFYMTPGVPINVTIKRGAERLDFTLIPTAERPR